MVNGEVAGIELDGPVGTLPESLQAVVSASSPTSATGMRGRLTAGRPVESNNREGRYQPCLIRPLEPAAASQAVRCCPLDNGGRVRHLVPGRRRCPGAHTPFRG